MTRRALIVVDVQNEYVSGALRITFPALSESLANIAVAMDVAAELEIPIVVVQQVAPETSPIFAKGSHGFALHEVVAGRPYDHLVEKQMPSAFVDTDLAQWLVEHGVDTVVVVGFMTQNCDESTTRDALHRGLSVEFLSDATGTLAMANQAGAISAEQLHRAVLIVLQSRFAAVCTTREWIDAVRDQSALARSSVFASTEVARTALG
ncbi:MAG: cysteine hydrolase family protein [Acidimicrobiales bacterium]